LKESIPVKIVGCFVEEQNKRIQLMIFKSTQKKELLTTTMSHHFQFGIRNELPSAISFIAPH